MTFYVYTLTDPRNGAVFYVGKGKRSRMYAHEWAVKRGEIPNGNFKLGRKIKKILSVGLRCVPVKVFESEDEQLVLVKECEWIATIGLNNLCNLTTGGQGETKSDESRKKLSASLKKTYSNPSLRAKLSDLAKQRYQNPEARQLMSEVTRQSYINHPQLLHKNTPEVRRKISEGMKLAIASGRRKSPKGFRHSLESKQQMSRTRLGKKIKPWSQAAKLRHSEIMKRRDKSTYFPLWNWNKFKARLKRI